MIDAAALDKGGDLLARVPAAFRDRAGEMELVSRVDDGVQILEVDLARAQIPGEHGAAGALRQRHRARDRLDGLHIRDIRPVERLLESSIAEMLDDDPTAPGRAHPPVRRERALRRIDESSGIPPGNSPRRSTQW